MIDLTPIDVRKKKGDFRRGIRGYETPQVDDFLELVADRLEAVVRENLEMAERLKRLDQQLAEFKHREKALTDALVTAQTMREEIRSRSAREGDELRRKAEEEAEQIRAAALSTRDREEALLQSVRSRQLEFLSGYRAFLERELTDLESQAVSIEERLGLRIPAAPTQVRAPWQAPDSDDTAEFVAEDVIEDAAPEPMPISDSAKDVTDPAPAFEWAPSEETFSPPAPPAKVIEAPSSEADDAEPEDALDAQLGSLLAEWSPGDADDDVDVVLSDADVEDEVVDEMDLFLSDDDVVAGASAADEHSRLFEDDEEAAFVAATGFKASPANSDDDAFELSENDVVVEDEDDDNLLDDMDIDALLRENDPFADEEPAFTIGPASKVEKATDLTEQAADDAAFLDDLNDEIETRAPEPGPSSRETADFDPFDDEEIEDDVEIEALDDADLEAVAEDDDEPRASEDPTPSDIAAAFGEEPDTLDHLLDAAGLSKLPPNGRREPESTGSFSASFGLTLRPTFGSNGAAEDEEDEAQRAPRSLGEVGDFYSVPRARE